MQTQIRLGQVKGIKIGLHYSWFIIAGLIAFSLAAHFHQVRPDWKATLVWTAAIITSVLFFVALLLHELAHSIVAKSRGLRVKEITLFALGGVSQIESEAADAKSEFWIAIVGPLTSLVIGGVLLGIARLSGWVPGNEPRSPVNAVLLWLGYINFALAAFNMIPGYPLDGGRVLRALLWWITHNAERATRNAAQVGQGVAIFFILLGLFRFFVGASFGGLWLALIGWFLLDAARSSYVQVGILARLRGHRVADIMERDCTTVPAYLNVNDFVDQYLLHQSERSFLVVQDGHAAGVITANDARGVDRERWLQTSVQSLMRPLSSMRSVPPEMPAVEALELMARNNETELAVISGGKLEGIVSRAQVLRFLQVYSEFVEPHSKAA